MSRMLIVLVLASLLPVDSSLAAGYSFSPVHTQSKLTGALEISAPGNGGSGRCKIVWRGKTHPSGKEFVFPSVVFSGRKPICQIDTDTSTFVFLPSGAQAVQSRQVQLVLDGPKKGVCTGVFEATVSPSGLWTFGSDLGGCIVTGSLQSTPPITVVPR